MPKSRHKSLILFCRPCEAVPRTSVRPKNAATASFDRLQASPTLIRRPHRSGSHCAGPPVRGVAGESTCSFSPEGGYNVCQWWNASGGNCCVLLCIECHRPDNSPVPPERIGLRGRRTQTEPVRSNRDTRQTEPATKQAAHTSVSFFRWSARDGKWNCLPDR